MPRTGDILNIAGQFYRLVPGIGDSVSGKSGSHGLVFAARHGDSVAAITEGPPTCAVKLLNPHSPAGRDAAAAALLNEIAMLQAFTRLPSNRRDAVPRLWGADPAIELPDGDRVPGLVIDYCTATLADLVAGGGSLAPEVQAMRRRLGTIAGLADLAAALASALIGLAATADAERPHAAHRDVRPANVYVRHGRFLLGDFGAGCRFDRGSATLIGFGSDEERPPELRAAARRAIGPSALSPLDFRPGDIWGIGLCLWHCLFDHLPAGFHRPLKPGDDPLTREDRTALRQCLVALPFDEDDDRPDETAGNALSQLIETCLNGNPGLRPDAGAVLSRSMALLHLPTNTRLEPAKRRARAPWRPRGLATGAIAGAALILAALFPALKPIAVTPYRGPGGDLLGRWSGHPYQATQSLDRTPAGQPALPLGERLTVSLRVATLFSPLVSARFVGALEAPDGSRLAIGPGDCRTEITIAGATLECAKAPIEGGDHRLKVALVRQLPWLGITWRDNVADASFMVLPRSIRK